MRRRKPQPPNIDPAPPPPSKRAREKTTVLIRRVSRVPRISIGGRPQFGLAARLTNTPSRLPLSQLNTTDGDDCDEGYGSMDDAYCSSSDEEDGQTVWQARKEREARILKEARPELVHLMVAHSGAASSLQSAERERVTQLVQDRVNAAAKKQCSVCSSQHKATASSASAAARTDVAVRLQHLTWSATVKVPLCACGNLLVNALEVGCFAAPTSVTAVWVPQHMLRFLRCVHEAGGLGAKGACCKCV